MNFERSTQVKSWIFSTETLEACRKKALAMEMESSLRQTDIISGRVRKFASGFHRRSQQESPAITNQRCHSSEISLCNQEILVQFHAHQIQFLVGPTALLYDLRTSEAVLSTAITFFRRFYLSNSIVEVSPRKIAAACAFFAAKVEEEKLEVRPMVGQKQADGTRCGSFCKISSSAGLCIFIVAIFLPRLRN